MKVEWKSCFRIGVTVFLLYLCIQYWTGVTNLLLAVLGAAAPLVLGCVMAYVLNILMSFYERHYFTKSKKEMVKKSKRVVCMLGSMVTLLAVVVLVVILVVPELASCVKLLIAEVPGAMKKAMEWINSLGVLPENIESALTSIDWEARMGQIVNVFFSGLGSVKDLLMGVVSSVVSGLLTFFLGIIFAIYLLSGKEQLGKQVHRVMSRYIKKEWCDKINYVVSVLDDAFHKYIVGQCTEAILLGVLCTLGMLLLQIPYATMVGALMAFTALIPVAGAYIGGGVGAFMILTVSPLKALIFLIFIAVLQQIEGNLIYPKVVGSSMGLPAIWVLAAVTVGGSMMGILGMLLGVPLAAAMYRLLKEDVNRMPKPVQEKTNNKTNAKKG